MPRITVASKKQFPDIINAASLFIDDMTEGLGIFVKLFFSDGSIEDQEITAGSKFLTGVGANIERVLFINPSVLSGDIEYHFSTLASYDEAKIIGDVNSLTRFDNLTKDNNEYIGGFQQGAAVGDISCVALSNEGLSVIYVSELKVACPAGSVYIARDTVLFGLTDWTTLLSYKHNKRSGQPNGDGHVRAGSKQLTPTTSMTLIPVDPAGSMTPLNFKNAPIELLPGELLNIHGNGQNFIVAANFEWNEEAI